MSRAPLTRRLGLAALVGLLTAALALGALEAVFRHQERGNGLWFPNDEPGRKWALLPREEAINADGFNEREIPFEKPEGTWRVVVVGDSVTFAGGVPREQGYTRVAEQRLQERGLDVEIVNLSVYGYDAEQVAATLHYRAWAYHPDLVVYAAYTNDGMPSRLVHAGEARSPVYVGNEPDALLGPLGDLLQRVSAVYRRIRGARYARVAEGDNIEDTERAVGFVAAQLADMKADAEAHETPLLVWLLTPHLMSDVGCATPPAQPDLCQLQLRWVRRMDEETRALGLPIAHSLGVWTAANREGFYNPKTPQDIHHPGIEGHLLLGAAFAEVLQGYRAGLEPLPRSDIPALAVKPDRPFAHPNKPERPPKKKRPSPGP
ncbi:MAG: hypothetical protein H6741_16910 [Alphaproteobacteria bacterium]|nr:hypothetical protein [Alphaproteobacteria bacterium]MCB9794397.1 hypothetical protein [Alphaproteobacteria bacterium]